MAEDTLVRDERRGRVWSSLRLLLAQGTVIGAAASLWLFVSDGVSTRSVGFFVFSCACAVACALLPRSDGSV